MPRPAHDRHRRGPLAALLILLGILVGSGPIGAAPVNYRGPAPRAGSDRHGSPAALVRVTQRDASADDDFEPNASEPPRRPAIVTTERFARPGNAATQFVAFRLAQRAPAAYRARGPPAA